MPGDPFDFDKLIERRAPADLFVQELVFVDLVPGPCVRFWLGAGDHRAPGFYNTEVRLTFPAETFMPARERLTAWMSQHRLLVPPRPRLVG